MKTVNNFSFTLKARLVEDDETGYFSATCPEFPEAFAQGKTESEALKNLVDLIPYVLKERQIKTDDISTFAKNSINKHIYSKDLNFSVSTWQ